MIQKETEGSGKYGLLHTVNMFFEKDVGPFGSTRSGFVPPRQSRMLLNPYFQPGFEIYSSIDATGRAGKFNDQQYNAGPVLVGSYGMAP
jgi:hypothetical protein